VLSVSEGADNVGGGEGKNLVHGKNLYLCNPGVKLFFMRFSFEL
jgi:hypothetical protein